jgi:phenylacetate-CoA ligase/benzoylacetate-CoA ligase
VGNTSDYWDSEFETMPWPWVQAWQAQRVAVMLEALPRRSEFYRVRLSGAGRQRGLLGYWVARGRLPSLEMMADMPLTTKDELRQGQEDAAAGAIFGRQQSAPLTDIIQVVSSSGTTGRPVFYGLTRHDLDAWIDAVATCFWTAGVRPDDVVAHLVSLPAVAGGWSYADGFRRLGATVAWLGGYQPEQIIARLGLLQVSALLATTSFAVYLTEQAVGGKMARDLNVRKLCAGGEPGMQEPEIRRKIAEGWGISHLRETMGLADVLSLMLSECDAGGGMHFNAGKSVALELIDPQSHEIVPWREGVRGEAVYTTFDREATPVLRYLSADHMEVTALSCPCGRTSPRMRCIGRTDDMLIYKAMNVFPSAIRDVISRRFGEDLEPYIRIWKDEPNQVRFDKAIPVEVESKTLLPRSDADLLASRISEAVRDALQVRVETSVVAPGTLPRSTYKTPLVQVKVAVGITGPAASVPSKPDGSASPTSKARINTTAP